jgi:hypothetical protein
MAIREGDALPYLRLKQKMQASPSDCNAVLKDGSTVQVYLFQGKPAIEINEQFFFADTYQDFVRYERKPLPAPIPEAPVQEVDNWVDRSEPVDTSGQRLRMQLQRNPDVIHKRNILRQVFGNLLVKEFLGVGERDSSTRYWYCRCKLTGKYVTATQAELVCGVVTCCNNAKTPTETIVNRGGRLP